MVRFRVQCFVSKKTNFWNPVTVVFRGKKTKTLKNPNTKTKCISEKREKQCTKTPDKEIVISVLKDCCIVWGGGGGRTGVVDRNNRYCQDSRVFLKNFISINKVNGVAFSHEWDATSESWDHKNYEHLWSVLFSSFKSPVRRGRSLKGRGEIQRSLRSWENGKNGNENIAMDGCHTGPPWS